MVAFRLGWASEDFLDVEGGVRELEGLGERVVALIGGVGVVMKKFRVFHESSDESTLVEE